MNCFKIGLPNNALSEHICAPRKRGLRSFYLKVGINKRVSVVFSVPAAQQRPYLVLSGLHALKDLFELAVVRAQKFEGLGHRGHGGGRGADQSAQLLQRRAVQLDVLLLSTCGERKVVFCVAVSGPLHPDTKYTTK